MTSRILRESFTQKRTCANTIGSSVLPLPSGGIELDRVLNVLDVPQIVRDSARAIYRRAVARETSLDGGVGKALASAAIYAAYRKYRLPKSVEEIAAAFGIEKAETIDYYTFLLNEMGYLSSIQNEYRAQTIMETRNVRDGTRQNAWAGERINHSYVERFLEKKGTYEFLRILKESPKRWKTLEKQLALSPRTLSERISESLELGFIEKVRRLKIGATYYKLTRKGNEILEAMTENTRIY